ncbi:MAG: hypothetical protein ACI9TF_000316, partial [Paracrocinitomix sp.]
MHLVEINSQILLISAVSITFITPGAGHSNASAESR